MGERGLFNGLGISVWQDEKGLDVGVLTLLNWILKMVEMENFVLCVFYNTI